LWPNEEGDAGKQCFGVTMVRLRKLLGTPEAITVSDERVSLNPAFCWVDARAFEGELKQAEALRSCGDEVAAMKRAQEVVALYKGAFLPSEAEEGWSMQMRLRLRGLFTSAIEDLGARCEAAGEWEQAIACYRRGLEADDLVEEFYLGQMRCYLAMHRHAEGMSVFRRLRQTLSVVLGVAPSPDSEAAARALAQTNRAVAP
jgi:DNA-binding SARP family transcriptional activator